MDVIPAVITGGAVIVGAVIAFFGVLYGHLSGRLTALEDDLKAAQTYNHTMWWYCRRLIDLYYRHRRDGAPDPDPLPEEPE